MKQLVCIAKTPETTSKITFNDDQTAVDESNLQYIMNPYDEWYALVRAIELKEVHGGTVTVVNVGPATNETVIRKALAIGADDAVRIDTEAHDASTVAKHIAAYAGDAGFDVILLGKESIDYNGSLVGAMLAEHLDLPYVAHATSLEIDGGIATLVRGIQGGTETIQVATPIVVSAAKGMAEQRIPNMRGIMMAKRKPLDVQAVEEITPSTEIAALAAPAAKSSVKMIDPDNMDELVRLLQEEAKVI